MGVAHGSAGIALALSQYAMATGDCKIQELATAIFESIYRGAGQSKLIHRIAGRPDLVAPLYSWCHGRLGILWAILQDPISLQALPRFIEGLTMDLFDEFGISNPTYCHGLSGVLETVRMLGVLPQYRAQANTAVGTLASLILEQKQWDSNNFPIWGSEAPTKKTPDLFIGSLAPATALALITIEESGPILGSEWLKKCSQPL